MTTQTEREANARARINAATNAAQDLDPSALAMCALAEAILVSRPADLRDRGADLARIIDAETAGRDANPSIQAARALSAALEAAAAELDGLDIGDVGFAG